MGFITTLFNECCWLFSAAQQQIVSWCLGNPNITNREYKKSETFVVISSQLLLTFTCDNNTDFLIITTLKEMISRSSFRMLKPPTIVLNKFVL